MTKSVCVLALLAAAVSTSAVAKDLKQNKQAPSRFGHSDDRF
jgi:opacity protein-like surface antigen